MPLFTAAARREARFTPALSVAIPLGGVAALHQQAYSCVLSGNSSTRGGGAFGGTLSYCKLSGNYGDGVWEATLFNCTLTGNSGRGTQTSTLYNCTLSGNFGGGAYEGTLYNCTLSGNSMSPTSVPVGGGSRNGTLYNCTLTGNSADYGGASWGSVLYNCIVASNSARYSGGGAYEGSLYNCTLSGNSTINGGAAYRASLYNCTLTGNLGAYGGGASGGTLSNCTLVGNSAGYEGGAAMKSTFYFCNLIGNVAGSSGGGASEGTLYNCAVSSNSAGYQGGGAFSSVLHNCTVTGNSATNSGGGAFSSVLYNCTVTGNSAQPGGSSGGGVTGGTLYNCTLSANTAGERGGGAHEATLYNCIVSGNTASVAPELSDSLSYRCWTENPAFVNPGVGDYHLLSNSPCIDAGIDLSAIIDDLDGSPRPLDGNGDGIATFDIGAYEFTNGPPTILAQPPSRTNAVGSSLMLSVAATGLNPLTYQWFRDGMAIPVGTGRTLVLTNVQPGDAGIYSVRVTHVTGFIMSSNTMLTVAAAQLPSAIAGPIVNPTNGHQYYLLAQSTWVEAEAAAQALGGHLATLRNPAEHQWVFTNFSMWNGQKRGLWIGLHDTDPVNNAADRTRRRGEFRWSSGEPLTYANWNPPAPNNRPELGEYYVHMLEPGNPTGPGTWNDAGDTDFNEAPLHGVVEVPLVPRVTHYVNAASPTPLAPYLTWETAAQTIQDGVDAASPGDIVLVTNGVYNTGGRAVVDTMTNRVAVDKVVTVQSVNGPEFTVIEGHQVPGTINGDGAIRCVYLTDKAVLSGFTLTKGATRQTGNQYNQDSGGGVLCDGTNAVVSNCVVAGNSARGFGGGGSWGTFYNCTFGANGAGSDGGQVAGLFGSPNVATLFDCILTGEGGGAWKCTLYDCSVGSGISDSTLYSCTVKSNKYGAYLSFLVNCLVVDSGGISRSGLENCTLVNTYAGGGYPAQLRNCIVPRDAEPGQFDVWVNCFTGDPKFVNPALGDYHLRRDSLCIDAGAGSFAGGVSDLDGNPRAMDGNGDGVNQTDIGAYEFDPRTVVPMSWFLSYGLDPVNSNVIFDNPDHDAFTTYQEWVADTDPTSAQSFFHIEGITASSPVTIFFQSSSNRLYTLRSATNLVSAVWTNVPGQIDVPGSGGMDALTDATNGAPKFYRLGVRAP
jgi:hypothetical protein